MHDDMVTFFSSANLRKRSATTVGIVMVERRGGPPCFLGFNSAMPEYYSYSMFE